MFSDSRAFSAIPNEQMLILNRYSMWGQVGRRSIIPYDETVGV